MELKRLNSKVKIICRLWRRPKFLEEYLKLAKILSAPNECLPKKPFSEEEVLEAVRQSARRDRSLFRT